MHPLFTVIAGVAAGVMGVRLAKSANSRKALQLTAAAGGRTVRTGLNQTQSMVRDVAVSGLKTIEKTSSALRHKLDSTSPNEVLDTPAHEEPTGAAQPNDDEKAS